MNFQFSLNNDISVNIVIVTTTITNIIAIVIIICWKRIFPRILFSVASVIFFSFFWMFVCLYVCGHDNS